MFCSEKEECITFFCLLHKSSVSHHHHRAPFRLLFPFGSLNYNKVCSTTATRQDFPILFYFLISFFLSPFFTFQFLQVKFPHVPAILDGTASSPTSQLRKSHACFEARSNKHDQEKKKYTECTYKHKKYLYIFIYLYI